MNAFALGRLVSLLFRVARLTQLRRDRAERYRAVKL
jgi:hypothetical protein